MTPATQLLLAALGGYLVGGIPFGLLIGKLHGVDVRQHGSGNIGATNVGRICGRRWGVLCFVLDAGKGFLPVWLAGHYGDVAGTGNGVAIVAALGAVGGHVWCPYLRFKGGKGIATAAGVLVGVDWAVLLAAVAVWIVLMAVCRYVSLASMGAAVTLPTAGLLLRRPWREHWPELLLLTVVAAIAVWRHRANLARLAAGTEPKIGSKQKTP